ncbi:MAG: TIGR04013 family B12-binding domain/radical SAM domain-containing protein [Methanoregula sp.]|nr:MAG: TIGR04013 family B12-binding domain/radical SAM domain-containing protein [Methanoregula sp.]
MKFNWRLVHAARNSYAALYAACEQEGFILNPVKSPSGDVTCYSLNSINEPVLREEIKGAGCITVAGGSHATARYRDVARYADYVVVGEGEFTLPRLLAAIENGNDSFVPGVATKEWYEPADTSVLLDAFPAFSQMKGYVEISRGCPFSCAYCQTPRIFGHCMRHRSIDAIASFANRYRHSRFVSPNAFAYGSDGIHPRWEKIGRLLEKLTHKIWFGTFPSEVRPEFVCDESLELVNRYCANTKLHFGAQSGSDTVLTRLNRGHTVADVIAAVELCRDYGIIPVVDFILGFPFETDEDQLQSVRLIQWVAGHGMVHAHRFMPLPGTPLEGSDAGRPLLPETALLLGKLALSGRLTGSWSEPKDKVF